MNTPSHSIINLLLLGQGKPPFVQAAIIVGSILPDAPMFLFYFVEKVINRTPEMQIWRESYYIDGWQNFFDIFNSLPLIVVGFVFMWWRQSSIGMALFASMVLHCLGDLPLHHDDGHRHFFPFSDWRFESPVSYWDPRHYGGIAAPIELTVALIGCVVLFFSYESWIGKGAIATIGLSYASFIVYALRVWA